MPLPVARRLAYSSTSNENEDSSESASESSSEDQTVSASSSLIFRRLSLSQWTTALSLLFNASLSVYFLVGQSGESVNWFKTPTVLSVMSCCVLFAYFCIFCRTSWFLFRCYYLLSDKLESVTLLQLQRKWHLKTCVTPEENTWVSTLWHICQCCAFHFVLYSIWDILCLHILQNKRHSPYKYKRQSRSASLSACRTALLLRCCVWCDFPSVTTRQLRQLRLNFWAKSPSDRQRDLLVQMTDASAVSHTEQVVLLDMQHVDCEHSFLSGCSIFCPSFCALPNCMVHCLWCIKKDFPPFEEQGQRTAIDSTNRPKSQRWFEGNLFALVAEGHLQEVHWQASECWGLPSSVLLLQEGHLRDVSKRLLASKSNHPRNVFGKIWFEIST